MPTYVVLVNWTDQGVAGFDRTTERVDHGRDSQAGGRRAEGDLLDPGPYDLVALIEAADDESIAAAMLGVGANGNSRTTTLRAFNREEYEAILAKVS